jgi:hypothetical protein
LEHDRPTFINANTQRINNLSYKATYKIHLQLLWIVKYFIRMYEDTNGIIKSQKSKKDRRYNRQKKDKWANDGLQNTTQKTKCCATRHPLSKWV